MEESRASGSAASPPALPAPPSGARKLLLVALALAVVVGAIELLSFGVLALAPLWLGYPARRTPEIFAEQTRMLERVLAARSDGLVELDGRLGWRTRAGGSTAIDHVNPQRVRAERTYAASPPDGVTRVVAFGDSFVYCTEVPDADSWPRIVEETHPDLEVMNFGVAAYGPDQAYLRFIEEGEAFAPKIALLGVSVVSLERVVNVYRRFLELQPGANFLTKPRFLPGDDGGLSLLPNPIPDDAAAQPYLADPRAVIALGAHDQWFEPAIFLNPLYDWSATVRLSSLVWVRAKRRFLDPERPLVGGIDRAVWNADASAFRILSGILAAFRAEAERIGARPLVVQFPDVYSVRRTQHGETGIFAPLPALCVEVGVPCLDLSDAFAATGREADVGAWFRPEGHYSRAGNEIAARAIAQRVREVAGEAASDPAR